MNRYSDSNERQLALLRSQAESAKFCFATPADIGLKRGAWEMFQDPKLIEIYARCFGWKAYTHDRILTVIKRVPLVGILTAKVFSPEAVEDGDWAKSIRELRAGHVNVLTNQPDPACRSFSGESPLYSCLIDLRMDQDQLYSRIESRGRRAILRAERAGMRVTMTDSVRQVGKFHRFMLRVTDNGRRYDVPPLSLLEDLTAAGYGCLHLATLGDDLIGGVYVVSGQYSHGLLSGFDYSKTGLPSNLVYWRAVLREKSKGHEFFDLGPQSLTQNETLIKFKRSFNPFLVPAYQYDYYPSAWRAAAFRSISFFRGAAKPAV